MKKAVIFDHESKSTTVALGIDALSDVVIEQKMDGLIDYHNDQEVSFSQFLEKLIRTIKGVAEGPEAELEDVIEAEALLVFFAFRLGEMRGKSHHSHPSLAELLLGGMPSGLPPGMEEMLRQRRGR